MSHRESVGQPATPSFRAGNARRLFPLARVLFFLALFLLPVQMRAGADDPHPHAALQLILDARDGAIDHHSAWADHPAPGDGASRHAGTPDLPTFGEASSIGAGLAILAVIIALFPMPAPEAPVWPLPAPRLGRSPALEPPPPRLGSAWS